MVDEKHYMRADCADVDVFKSHITAEVATGTR